MSAPNIKDFGTLLIASPPTDLAATSLQVEAGKADRLPAVPFDAVAHPEGELPTLDNSEKVQVTAVDGAVLTIVRAQGDTSAKTMDTGWRLSAANFASHVSGAYDRANHTGAQAISTVTDLQSTLDGKATAAQGAKADTATQPADLAAGLATKQDTLVSGTNIKSINGTTLLGAGDITIESGAVDSVNAQTGAVVLTQDNVADGATYKQYSQTEKTKLAGIATAATANDTDANLKARANHTGTQTASTISDFSTAADARIAAAAGTSVASLTGGKVPTSQLPAVSLTSVQTAASEVDQLALTTQEGDLVVRTDENKTYMRNAGTSGTMTDYTLLNTPADAVTSVNGQTGVVVLGKADVSLGNVDNTSDADKPVSTATQTALDTKVAGPATATDTAIPTYDGTTGELIKDNPNVLIDADGSIIMASTGYQSLVLTDGDIGGLGASTVEILLDNTDSWGQGINEAVVAPSGGSSLTGLSFLDTSATPMMRLDYATGGVVLNNAISGSAIADEDTMTSDSATKVPTQQSVKAYVDTGLAAKAAASHTHAQADVTNLTADLAAKQDALVSGTNIKTVNSTSLLGSGDIVISGSGQELYDHIVAPSGGDYTTLGAALAAATTGQSIYIRAGTYTESAITSTLADITIVGENNKTTILDFSTNALTFSGNYVKISNVYLKASTGRLALTGTNAELRNCYMVVSSTPATTAHIHCTGADTTISGLFYATSVPGTSRTLPAIVATQARFRLVDSYLEASQASSATAVAKALVNTNSPNSQITGNVFYSSNGTYQTVCVTAPQYSVVANNRFSNCGGTAILVSGGSFAVVANNAIEAPTTAVAGYGIYHDGASETVIANNAIRAANTPNYIGIYCTNNGSDVLIQGNTIRMNTGAGIHVLCSATQVFDNRIARGAAGNCIIIANEYCTVSNNYVTGYSVSASTPITDSAVVTNILGNVYYTGTGVVPISEKRVTVMRNGSGGTINAGDIVIHNAVASGLEVTRSTTAGDNRVMGVSVVSSTSSPAAMFVQTAGKTTLLKVDGTTDIAIGDFISCFTTAGIGQKASAGHTAIAIALEAYAANDSNGVIDALIIPPRVV